MMEKEKSVTKIVNFYRQGNHDEMKSPPSSI